MHAKKSIVPLEGISASPIHTSTDYAHFLGTETPIVIDQGSYACRAGWGSENEPRLIFHPFVNRSKGKQAAETIISIGSPTGYLDQSKTNCRSPHDGELLVNFDVQEYIFDTIFEKLGINTDRVLHPIMMSEPFANPNYCRAGLSELLFECYQAPSVCYGVDALFSFYYNQNSTAPTGLIYRSGNHASHIIPLINGDCQHPSTRRMNVGGFHTYDYCTRIVHLRYPHLRNDLHPGRCQEIKEKHLYVASNFQEELCEIQKNHKKAEEAEVTLQLPYVKIEAPVVSEEEKERKAQIRRDNIQKMKDMAARKRQEKLQQKEKELSELTAIKESKHEDPEYFKEQLEELGYKSEIKLDKAIAELSAHVDKLQGKTPDPQAAEQKEPLFPLLDIPDDQLSPGQLAEKKKQKLLKVLHDGRVRAKKKKEEQKLAMEQQESVDEAKRKEDLQGWLAEIHQRRNTIIQRKARLEEQRAQVNNRRSELSKKRMRLLASAAAEGDIEESFGANDEDWQVYKEMSKEVESDSEDDERLEKLTTLLIKYDPKFASSETGATNADDPDAYYQVSLSSERVRFPEVIFQPSIIGVDNAGPLEIMQSILQKYDRETQLSLAKNVFLTGGNTMYKGIVDRFTNDIRSIRPVNSTIRYIFLSFFSFSIHCLCHKVLFVLYCLHILIISWFESSASFLHSPTSIPS
eukprot:TRINITY_DN436_c0_g1_i4.p1 TRINITY_DN436_c0_g1~~TRINITY_DN436_c0_g1_i4.p1  ORF type:complete len:689 (+),score=125.62 TRINITY_DN436_c0_g1_i4:47-2113(+)